MNKDMIVTIARAENQLANLISKEVSQVALYKGDIAKNTSVGNYELVKLSAAGAQELQDRVDDLKLLKMCVKFLKQSAIFVKEDLEKGDFKEVANEYMSVYDSVAGFKKYADKIINMTTEYTPKSRFAEAANTVKALKEELKSEMTWLLIQTGGVKKDLELKEQLAEEVNS